MNSRRVLPLALALLAAPSFAAETPSADAPAVVVRQFEMPRLKRSNIEWPGDRDREALVYVEFDLSPEGKVTDARLAAGGFHDPRFVQEALRGLRGSTFEPAREAGKPIAYAGLVIPVHFHLDVEKGITREFRQELDNSRKFIENGDYAGGHFHTEWMLSEKVKLGYEYAVLQAQLAHTHAAVGNVDRALEAAAFATSRTTPRIAGFDPHAPVPELSPNLFLLPKGAVGSLLDLRVRLYAQQGLAIEALESYYELAGLMKKETHPAMHEVAAQLRRVLDGDGALVGKVVMTERGFWRHQLYRRTFSIGNVQGELRKVRLTCEGKQRDLKWAPDTTWTVPATWRSCSTSVDADPGTRFQFVEYPVAAATAR